MSIKEMKQRGQSAVDAGSRIDAQDLWDAVAEVCKRLDDIKTSIGSVRDAVNHSSSQD